MQDSAVRHLDRGRRVADFTATHTSFFPAGSRAAALIVNILAMLAAMEAAGAKQEGAERAGQEATEQRRAARTLLLRLMRAISHTARGMNKLHPGIADLFRMPHGGGDQILINAARAFITEATPFAAEFTGRGLPANFLTALQDAIDQLVSTIEAQAEARGTLTKATAAIKAAQKQLTDDVNELSPIVRNTFRDDPATLAAWESASHVERAPKKKATKTPPPPTP
jgi:hypothetical protein